MVRPLFMKELLNTIILLSTIIFYYEEIETVPRAFVNLSFGGFSNGSVCSEDFLIILLTLRLIITVYISQTNLYILLIKL